MHAQFADNLRATAWNTRAEGALTTLHTLSGMHENSASRAMKARDAVADSWRRERVPTSQTHSCRSGRLYHCRTLDLTGTPKRATPNPSKQNLC